MPKALRPIGHEDRLSLVDHLDELRRRIVISIVTLVAAFALCFWQNDAILDVFTEPVRSTQNIDDPSPDSRDPLEQAARFQLQLAEALRAAAPALADTSDTLGSLGRTDTLSAAQRRDIATTGPCQPTDRPGRACAAA